MRDVQTKKTVPVLKREHPAILQYSATGII